MLNENVFFRKAILKMDGADLDARTVTASLSSETQVNRWFGSEVLVHEFGAVDMARAGEGMPLLWHHDPKTPIGRVENIHLASDRRLRGDVRFSRNGKAEEVFRDVTDGILRDLSVGYQILSREEKDKDGVARVTRWAPFEVSVVSVGADPTVGVNRQHKVNYMPNEPNEQASGTPEQAQDGINVVEFSRAQERNRRVGAEEGVKTERARIRDIRQIFSFPQFQSREFQDLMDECIDKGVALEGTRDALIHMVGQGYAPIAVPAPQAQDSAYPEGQPAPAFTTPRVAHQAESRGGYVQAGSDALDTFRDGVTRALLVRTNAERGTEEIKKASESPYIGMTPYEMAREFLRLSNIVPSKMTRDGIIGEAMTRGIAQGSSHFTNILENVAEKQLLMGFMEAPETWQQWCKTGTLNDFKQSSRVNISTFGDLDLVYENGEYNYGTFSDLKETLQLATYGKKFSIPRQALVNDDLSALGQIPRAMGRAAARKIGDLAYAVLTTNAALNQDSIALFEANTHLNLVASGAAPSVATLNTAEAAMAKQTDPTGSTLNIMPRYLIVPVALKATSRELLNNTYDPTATAGTLLTNPWNGVLMLVADSRLDANSATAWYLAGDPMMFDTIEVAFLNGQQSPYLESQDGWNVDGVEYKVRIDAVAGALDYRALYKNAGT